ncbi:MAG: hypothetical protein V1659_01120 [Candidatus Woesearchaeota archaeon]
MASESLKNLFRSINPSRYSELTSRPMPKAYTHLLLANVLSVIVIFVIAAVMLFFIRENFDSKISSFQTFKITPEISSAERVVLHRFPGIAYDANKTAPTSEMILFTNSTAFFKPVFFKEFSFSWKNIDFKQDTGRLSWLTAVHVFLLLPGLLFIVLLLNLILTYFMANIIAYIAWFVTRFTSFQIRFSQVLKITFYSTTIMMLFYSITLLFFYFWWLNLIIYLLFVVLAIFMTGEKKFGSDRGRGDERERSSKHKKHKSDEYKMIETY